jgi:ferredoxin
MSITAEIDTAACAAHGDCEAVAPSAFRVDGDVAVVLDTSDPRALRAAAAACPAGAIILRDAETGEEIDP